MIIEITVHLEVDERAWAQERRIPADEVEVSVRAWFSGLVRESRQVSKPGPIIRVLGLIPRRTRALEGADGVYREK